jgi:acetyl-CoA carboxylase biotin carboxyl carrier protein
MAKSNVKKTSTAASKPAARKSQPASKASTMKTSEIRDLIDFISKTGLNEVNIETSELKLHVKREPDQKILKSAAPVMTAPVTATPAATLQPTAASGIPKTASTPEVQSGKKTVEIKSPMIGTFYRSANPDSPVFVSVGDQVTKGQTLCIIEAMKLFNEIESEVSGTIVKILVDNATPVEYDQVLFVVEPD